MLFRRNDKGKTSFAFMLRTQAKAFDEGMFSTSSRGLAHLHRLYK